MNKKAIGVFIFLLAVCLFVAPLSASASYAGGDSPLVTALHGTDTGDLLFTVGDSYYASTLSQGSSYTIHYNVSGIPAGASITTARLYYYYSWGDGLGQASMTLNGQSVAQLNSYWDSAGGGSYDKPSGTISYDATGIVSSAGNGSSTSRIFGSGASARARATRCFMPPDSW